MKTLSTVLAVFFCIGAKAQIGITAFGGGAIYSPTSAPSIVEDKNDLEAKGGYQLGIEVSKGLGELFYIGAGFMAHKPTINAVPLDTLATIDDATKVHLGSPALSFYATAGISRSIMKVDLSAGLALGYTTLSGTMDSSANERTITEGGGLYAGLNVGLGYRIAGPLSIGLRTGVQYHALNIKDAAWDGGTPVLAVPIALTLSVRF